jgi:hypothetical protein
MIDDDDQLLQALAHVPPVEVRVEWEARVRARCHSAISRRVSRRARSRRHPFARLVDLAAVALLCVYLAAVLTEAARLASPF